MAAPTGAVRSRMGAGDWGLLIGLSVLWGGSFFFVGVAVDAVPVLTLVTLRVGLAAGLLWLFLWATGQARWLSARVWLAFAGMGALNNAIPFSLIVWGQQEIASGLASILNATTPLFTVVFASLLLTDEPLTRARLVGVLTGLCGVVVLIGPAALSGLGSGLWRQAAILAAAVSYALAGVYGRRFKQIGVPPVTVAAGQVAMSALMLAPFAVFVDRPWALPWPDPAVIAAIFGLAALSTALAYVVYFVLLARVGATNLLIVTLLIPVSAILLGVAFLGEVLRPGDMAGMALIGLGLAAVGGLFGRADRR